MLLALSLCVMCVFGLWASVRYAGVFTWLGVFPILVGSAAYLLEHLLLGRTVPKSV